MNITSRSRNRLIAGRHFQGHIGSALSRSVSHKVGLTRDRMTNLRVQQKTSTMVWRWSTEGAGVAQSGEDKTTEGPDTCPLIPEGVSQRR